MTEPDYIVLRPGPGLPPGWLGPRLEGWWFDRNTFPEDFREGNALAVPSGRFEVREDGAVAEVWEVSPT